MFPFLHKTNKNLPSLSTLKKVSVFCILFLLVSKKGNSVKKLFLWKNGGFQGITAVCVFFFNFFIYIYTLSLYIYILYIYKYVLFLVENKFSCRICRRWESLFLDTNYPINFHLHRIIG